MAITIARPEPRKYGRKVSLRVSDHQWGRIEQVATANGVQPSVVVRELLERCLSESDA